MLSSSARHDASMMFELTPMVVQSRSPSVASSSTRVTAPGGAGAVEDAHLEVGEVHPVEVRVGAVERRPQRRVDGVHRAVALGRRHPAVVADPHLHRRLGGEVAARQLVGDDAHALDAEEVLLPPGGPPHQQLERGVGGLEVVALVLEPLEVVDHAVDGRPVHLEAELGGLHRDRRPPGHLADDEAGAVADRAPGSTCS